MLAIAMREDHSQADGASGLRSWRDDRYVNHRPKEDVCHPLSCWTCAVAGARRRPCPASIKVDRRATRGSGIRLTHRRVEEIIAVMHAAGDDADAIRLRGLIVVLWRAGLRISEALTLNESDLDAG